MFDWLVELFSGAWWAYPLLVVVVVFDAVFPVLPSETALIATGIIAARDGLSVVGLIAAGWLGAVVGDNLTYTIGSHPGHRLRDRLLRSDKARSRVRWISHQLDERPWIVGVARFIPGGRTAASFSAGSLDMPRRRFLLYVVPGGLLWSAMGVLLGYAGGTLFRQNFWLPLLVSLAIAGALSAVAELARRRGWLGPDVGERQSGD